MSRAGIVLIIALTAKSAVAEVFTESEPNDSKATADAFPPLTAGDVIQGNSFSGDGTVPDYFRVKTTPMPLGVYRHRLVITSATGVHTGQIRGLAQTASGITPGSDATVQQTFGSPPRFLQWYGFGKEEEIYVRIQGTAATTADYFATLSTDPVSFVDTTVFYPGPITITTAGMGHATDTDLWVYDFYRDAIVDFGNDNGVGLPNGWSSLTRTITSGGEFYLALTNFNLANNLASPADDDRRTGAVLDFPNAVVNGLVPNAPLNLQFSITDSTGIPFIVPNTKNEPYDVNWFRFIVYPADPTGACCMGFSCTSGHTFESCASSGGSYQGDGTSCGPGVCESPQPGACCQPNGTCSMTTLPECTGMFLGPSTSCTPNPCAQPTGACCGDDGQCTETTQAACTGSWQGAGTDCSPNSCPQPGACCFDDGHCESANLISPGDCAPGGTYEGDGTSCTPNNCPQPDCNANGTPDAEDILGGTSQDCNANDTPDECDIASGTSLDFDGDGVPDECDDDDDGDGVPDGSDSCPNTVQGASVDANGCPPVMSGDGDHDGDIDLADQDAFNGCMTDPGAPGCDAFDFDGDGQVTLSDWASFQICFSGSGVPADPDCAN